MNLWIVWLIGLAITIFTSILIYKKVEVNKIIIDILVAISIALVGGIAEGWVIGLSQHSAIVSGEDVAAAEGLIGIAAFFSSILIWLVGALVLNIFDDKQNNGWEIASFIVVYIIASICWAQPFINYNKNIEDVNETIIIGEQEYELLSFCDIPVQKVSGNVSGDVSGSIFWVDGEISGGLSTSEEFQYWYVNGNGDGKYNAVPTSNSAIRFIEDGEKPRVKIIAYRNQERTINHNNGKETVSFRGKWNEYIFYLPRAMMQYSLG